MKVIKEDLNTLRASEVETPIKSFGALNPTMTASINDTNARKERIKALLKEYDAEVKTEPFTGSEEERMTKMPKTKDLKDLHLVEGFSTYKNLWEEVSYRLERTYHRVNAPAPGVYDPVTQLGIDHSMYNDKSGHGYLGTTISVNSIDELDFAKKICAEYNLPEAPWSSRKHFVPPEYEQEGYYVISPAAPDGSVKMYVYVDAEAPARHNGFVSTAKKNKDKAKKEELEETMQDNIVLEEVDNEDEKYFSVSFDIKARDEKDDAQKIKDIFESFLGMARFELGSEIEVTEKE